jgi:hypothetical protein
MVRLLHDVAAPDRVHGNARSTLLAVMTWLLRDPVARWLVVGSLVAMVVSEVVATYLGQARDGERHLLGSLAESLLHVRRRDAAVPQDRWTKWIIVLASRVALVAALAIVALVPGLRAYANDWWTLGLGSPLSSQGSRFVPGRS